MEQIISLNPRNEEESETLESWVNSGHTQDEYKEVFLNMDRALKYIHEHNYCIRSFVPSKIDILNNSLNQIRFSDIMQMPNDPRMAKNIVKEDIYNSSFIQIGLYTKCLYWLRRDFLKSNFDDFIPHLPESEVPYYRGVVERGAAVYLCEYAEERTKRDLIALEKELNGEQAAANVSALNFDTDGINDHINDSIYKQISHKKSDAAFVTALIFPTLVLSLAFVFALIIWFVMG